MEEPLLSIHVKEDVNVTMTTTIRPTYLLSLHNPRFSIHITPGSHNLPLKVKNDNTPLPLIHVTLNHIINISTSLSLLTRNLPHAQRNLHPIHRTDPPFFPTHTPALPRVVLDTLGSGERRDAGHVDDAVLEYDHHCALVCPEGEC